MKTFTIGWLNKCRCGNKSHSVKTARGNESALWDDDAVKCNSCGRGGVIQVCEGQARVLWETDEEMAEGKPMSTITKERVAGIANGEKCYTHDDVVELARIALASLEAEPIGAFHIADQQVGGTSDYIKDGEWPIDNGVIEVYAAPPAPVVDADPVVFTDERNLHHIARGRETSLIWGKQNQEVGDIPLYRHAQPVPVVPDEMVTSDDMNLYQKSFAQGYNACRNAMLNGGKS